MSKKRRENQAKREASQWTRTHTIIAAGVVAFSAIAAIVVFTIFVGTSFGEDKQSIADGLPALGSAAPVEKSTASDALNKPWDDLSQDDRRLIATEVARVFANATFRASSGLLTGIDVQITDGQTQFARTYQPLKDPVAGVKFAESLVVYCPADSTTDHAYKYFTTPTGTTFSDQVQDEGTQPWETMVSRIDWDRDVSDLGFTDVAGRKAHGYRVSFEFPTPDGLATKHADYWFDTETARLLQRQEVIEGQDTSQTRYILRYGALPPPRIDADQPQPDCVPDTLAKYGNG